MGKGADMSWEDIQNEFDIMNRMSCRPVGLQKVPGNHIFDEDQSVKWNREQVELNNKKYQSEVARLNTEKNKARDSVYNLIIEKIQYEVGHRQPYWRTTAPRKSVTWSSLDCGAYQRGR